MFKEQANGQLYFKGKEVTLHPCFPSQDRMSCISILDDDQNEVFFLKSLNELEVEQQEIVVKHLYIEELGHEITKILEIVEEIELRKFLVETRSGIATFYMRSEEWPNKVRDDHFQFLDIHGDIFYIKELLSLDTKSQKRVSPFIN
ncbi:hypothetical protein A9Q84_02095 [Halobacteriovorax marinus]|uniref:DUF1854 domain-containing protein n=1 Tax=Halobacteriovorax marinus TaxID=97084 RepID=A0A1Y5FCC3_9BACT|nr:hypothetical protein A9Q84_02095 [Halobacteriovorax marinus]